MKIGMIGLGKLGLPVALAINDKGHELKAYDLNAKVYEYLEKRAIPFKEEGTDELLANHTIETAEVEDIVSWANLIFMPIQTPHEPQFEGATRIPEERADFDYTWLKSGIEQVANEAAQQQKHVTLVVISTCLPGTYEREIKPLLNKYIHYIYNPFFIAMGTVVADFLNPEFVLLGLEDEPLHADLMGFYSSIHNKPLFPTDIATAEGIKVFYNTFITMKTVLANTYGEMAHKLGMNVDDIFSALSMATDRIISPRYLKAGMGDGGGCHPRDNIALSHLARQIDLSHNIFEDLMQAREDHAEWLAMMLANTQAETGLPIVILGRAFKPETNIETGSPAKLVSSILSEMKIPHQHSEDHMFNRTHMHPPQIVLIGTQHERYRSYRFPKGSIVIDPFGYIPDLKDVEVVRIGRP